MHCVLPVLAVLVLLAGFSRPQCVSVLGLGFQSWFELCVQPCFGAVCVGFDDTQVAAPAATAAAAEPSTARPSSSLVFRRRYGVTR